MLTITIYLQPPPIGSLCFKFGELSHGYTSLIAIPTLFHPSPGNVRFLFHVWLGVVGGCVTATQGRNPSFPLGTTHYCT